MKHQPFEAVTSDLMHRTLPVTMKLSLLDGQPMMVIRYGKHMDEITAITKQQAMDFFGLVEPIKE